MNPMNASEPREDAVADAFRALDEAIAYEGDCTARKGLRKARETFAALAQQGAEPVAWQCRHRASKAKPWSEWEECDHDSYVDITRRQPAMWEARALVPATGATR